MADSIVRLIATYYPKFADKARAVKLVNIDAKQYYGEGYQDVSLRVPAIRHAATYLNWKPQVEMEAGLRKTLDFYLA